MWPGTDLVRELSRPQPPEAALAQGCAWLEARLKDVSPTSDSLEALLNAPIARPHPSPEGGFMLADPWVRGLDGIWLGRITHPAIAHEPETALLLTLRKALSRCILDCHDHPAQRQDTLTDLEQAGAPKEARSLALCLLSLRHHPLRYRPEIVGVTLGALRRSPLEPFLGRQNPSTAFWIQTLSSTGLSAPGDRLRCLRAVALYQDSVCRLALECAAPPRTLSHRAALAERLQHFLPKALGYHTKLSLDGCPMDALFLKGIEGQPEDLLRALEQSPWTRGSPAEQSPLLRAMDFGGPMYGIFDEADRALFKAWILAPDALIRRPPLNTAHSEPPVIQKETNRPKGPPIAHRQLYPRLLSSNHAAETPEEALQLIQRVLARTRRLQALHLMDRAFPYSEKALSAYVERLHQKAQYCKPQRTSGSRLRHADWRWILLQLTPAILVDGCWLQGLDSALPKAALWQKKLQIILEDELGQGDPIQNHANVQRRLLVSLELELEDFRSEKFANNPALINAAFTLPNYLLAIGFHAVPFTPEILGLNLAIELSGLGQGYVRVVEALKRHGINPLIIQLHLSIDNLASGHARLAVEAINDFLEQVLRREGPKAQQDHWQRIYCGFLSLRVALLGFGFSLARHLLLRQTRL